MDAHISAGRLIFAALPGPDLAQPDESALRDLQPAGVILFDRNIKTASQVRDLIAAIRETSGAITLVGVDLEGGRVNRLRSLHPGFAALPAGRVQTGWDDVRLEATWSGVGGALAALGFDLDFTPVVDLDDGDGANAIGDRSLGVDPQHVTRVARAMLRGLAAAGIAGCLKHFPGLGGTDLDTHQALAVSPLSAAQLWDRHTVPYRALASEAAFVMTAHAHYPELDGPAPLPATFSVRMLRDGLRDRIGFAGVVISDDLEMGAVANTGLGPGEKARRALEAGCDLALFCGALDAPRRARDELARALDSGQLARWIAGDSGTRLAEVRATYAGGRSAARSQPAFEVVAAALHATLQAPV